MDLEYFITRMTGNAETIRTLVADVDDEQLRWKPAPGKWSILEVVNHLRDEERDDFRTRLDLLLHHPGQTWPPIDPPGWAIERRYNERNRDESLNGFLAERAASLEWLKRIGTPDWSRSYDHPLGRLSAGDLMVSWLAHDYLHIRQIGRLHWEYLSVVAPSFERGYAGEW
jgi:hypothetical protein